MQSSKWNAMSLLMDDKTKQAEVLRTAIDEADAIVIELVQACLHRRIYICRRALYGKFPGFY